MKLFIMFSSLICFQIIDEYETAAEVQMDTGGEVPSNVSGCPTPEIQGPVLPPTAISEVVEPTMKSIQTKSTATQIDTFTIKPTKYRSIGIQATPVSHEKSTLRHFLPPKDIGEPVCTSTPVKKRCMDETVTDDPAF